jgi:hypothetical protein
MALSNVDWRAMSTGGDRPMLAARRWMAAPDRMNFAAASDVV